MIWKKNLTLEKGCQALRTLTARNQSDRKILTTGTLRQDAMDSPTSNAKCKIESLLLCNPNSVEVFRAIAITKSGKQLFKRYWDKVTIKVTTSTYFTDAGKVIRKSDISLKLNNSKVSGRQRPSKQVTGKRMKRQRKLSSSSSSDELLVPRAQAHPRQLSASTKLAVPAVPIQGQFRTIAPGITKPAPQSRLLDHQSQ